MRAAIPTDGHAPLLALLPPQQQHLQGRTAAIAVERMLGILQWQPPDDD